MGEPPVRLPDPSADDAEDVVWGISTARTLWTRGERRDAITWIRRAADAARAAGQGFRATELTMYASEIEDELERWMTTAAGNVDTAESREASVATIGATPAQGARPQPTQSAAAASPGEGSRPSVEAGAAPAPPRPTPAAPRAVEPTGPSKAGSTPAAKKAAPAPLAAPILDPWAEEPTSPGTFRTEFEQARDEAPTRHEVTTPSPNVLVVEMRARAATTAHRDDDDDVMTSAPPLDEVLKRRTPPRAPPPLPAAAKVPPPPSSRGGSVLAAAPSGSDAASPASRPPASAGGAPRAQAQAPTPPAPTPVITPASPPSSSRKGSPEGAAGAPPMARQSFAGLRLDEIAAFADLPTEVRDLLTEVARVEDLGQDEEIAMFGAVLVIQGAAVVCATIVDTPAHRAPAGTLIAAKGSLSEGTKLRVVAGAGGARVAVWNQAVLDMALKSCPWVLEELKTSADRLQALAGATMGPMGELDEAMRTKITDRMSVRAVRPLETVISQGSQLEWLGVVGAGFVDLLKGEPARVTGDVRPGDFVFPVVALRDLPVPTSVRGGPAGAILLFGDRGLAVELFGGTPPLIDILGE